ncbi:MAG: PAS domain-containing protein, partial [Planctomycetes bacterium]|nr:PAS domain-containing protein [Planctomycetota bacterium]
MVHEKPPYPMKGPDRTRNLLRRMPVRWWAVGAPLLVALLLTSLWAVFPDPMMKSWLAAMMRLGAPTAAFAAFVLLSARATVTRRRVLGRAAMAFAAAAVIPVFEAIGRHLVFFAPAEELAALRNADLVVGLVFATVWHLAMSREHRLLRRRLRRFATPTMIFATFACIGLALATYDPYQAFGDLPRFVLGSMAAAILLVTALERPRRGQGDILDPFDAVLRATPCMGVAAMLLIAIPGEANAYRFFLERTLLITAFLPPVIASTSIDWRLSRRSFPSQLRVTFVGMMLVTLAVSAELLSVFALQESRSNDSATRHVVSVLQRDAIFLLGTMLSTLCGAMYLVSAATRRFTQKASELVRATRQLAEGQFDARVRADEGSDLYPLALSFNAMAERMALQQQEMQILAQVMDGTSDPVAVMGPDHRIIFVNNAFQTATGIERKRVLGMPYEMMFRDPISERRLAALWPHVCEHRKWSGEMVLHGASNRRFECFVTIAPVERHGKTIYYVAVHRDIGVLHELENERIAFAEALLKIHRIGQHVVESLDLEEIVRRLTEGVLQEFGICSRIWIAGPGDRCGDCRLAEVCTDREICLRPVDPELEDLRLPVGVGVAGAAAKSREHFVSPEPWEAPELYTHEDLRLHLDGGARVAVPLIHDGILRGVFEVATVDPESDRVSDTIRLLGQLVSEAISNSLLHKRALRQASALEKLTAELEDSVLRQKSWADELRRVNHRLVEADRLRSRFLATTSHELRTPLSGAMGYLRLILDGLADDREEELSFIRDAHACTEHLLEIINDVLDIAKIEAGRMVFRPQTIDIRPIIGDVLRRLESKADEKSIA